jgi:hypothetical protein
VLALDAANIKSYASGSSTWYDLSGGANNATLISSSYSTSNAGILNFNGTSSYASTIYTASLSVSGFAWVYFNSFTSAMPPNYGGASILKNWAVSAGAFHFDAFTNGAGKLSLFINNGSSTPSITDSTTLSTSTWYHCGFTIGSGSYSIYKNGVSVASSSYTGNLYLLRPNLGIGVKLNDSGSAPDSSSPYYLNGSIANVKLYNRALSPAEVQQNFNAQRSRFGL